MCYIMTISKYIEKYALERATTCPQDWWTLEGSHKQPRATRAAARRLAFIAKNLDPKKWWTSKINDMQNNIGKKQSKDEQSNAVMLSNVLLFCRFVSKVLESLGKCCRRMDRTGMGSVGSILHPFGCLEEPTDLKFFVVLHAKRKLISRITP